MPEYNFVVINCVMKSCLLLGGMEWWCRDNGGDSSKDTSKRSSSSEARAYFGLCILSSSMYAIQSFLMIIPTYNSLPLSTPLKDKGQGQRTQANLNLRPGVQDGGSALFRKIYSGCSSNILPSRVELFHLFSKLIIHYSLKNRIVK